MLKKVRCYKGIKLVIANMIEINVGEINTPLSP